MEERLVTDGEFYNELLIAEDELIDQYCNDELSASERERFETHFLLTSERRQKVRFGRAFNKYVSSVEPLPDEELVPDDVSEGTRDVPKPPPKWHLFSLSHIRRPAVRFALAGAALVFLVGSWMIVRNWTQPEPHDILTELVTPSRLTRGDRAELRKFSIPPGKDTVRLQLELIADDYQAYRAVLQDAAGTVVIQKDSLRAQRVSERWAVILDVPVGKLPSGSYQVKLKGMTASGGEENAGSYYFTVSR